jgi:hypothetical protein
MISMNVLLGVSSGRGDHILRQVTLDTPRWAPGSVHAGAFLETLSRQTQAVRRQIA